MRPGYIVLTLILMVAPGVARAAGPERTVALEQLGSLRVGAAAPWFAGADARAPERAINRTKLLAAKRPFALVFWATWCAPCRAGLGLLRAGAERLKAAGVDVVLVNFREPQEEVSAFLDAERLDGFPVILDRFGKVAKAYEVAPGDTASLPRTFVIGADGRIAAILDAEGPDYVDRVLEAAAPAP